MNLNKLVMESLKELDKDERIKEIVKVSVENTMAQIIQEVYGPDSIFYSTVKDKIKKELEINTDKISINSYNELIKTDIINAVEKGVKEKAREGIKNTIDKVFESDVPDTYNFSDILEHFKESVEYKEIEDQEEMSLYIGEQDRWIKLSFIYFDAKGNVDKYICRNKIVIDVESQEIVSFNINKKDITKGDVIGGLYGLERHLFNLMAKGTKIVFDKGLKESSYDLKYNHNKYAEECC